MRRRRRMVLQQGRVPWQVAISVIHQLWKQSLQNPRAPYAPPPPPPESKARRSHSALFFYLVHISRSEQEDEGGKKGRKKTCNDHNQKTDRQTERKECVTHIRSRTAARLAPTPTALSGRWICGLFVADYSELSIWSDWPIRIRLQSESQMRRSFANNNFGYKSWITISFPHPLM